MKTFMLTLLFIGATFFPILFIPLLALTLLIMMIIGPHIYDLWSTPKNHSGNPAKD